MFLQMQDHNFDSQSGVPHQAISELFELSGHMEQMQSYAVLLAYMQSRSTVSAQMPEGDM